MATTQPTVKQAGTIKVNKKGQFTIPKSYREALGIEAGASFSLLPMGDGLMLLPDLSEFNRLCDSIADKLKKAGIGEPEVLASLPQTRQRVFEKHYPELAAEEKAKRRAKRKSS